MSSLDGKSTCNKSVDGGGKGASLSTSNKKECTSFEQKVESCKDGASNSTHTSGSDFDCNLSDIDAVAEGVSKVDLSNDDNNNGRYIDISDEKLFADPPPKEDCPICMLPMPFATGLCDVRKTYHSCCGKTICEGCIVASMLEVFKGNLKELCAFCRIPSSSSDKEEVKRFERRMKLNDPEAFRMLGDAYLKGELGLIKNSKKAVELWKQAAELGSLDGYFCLATAYRLGDGVEKDLETAIYYYKLAAIGGCEYARNSLALIEYENGNIGRAMKHFLISARCGHDDSLHNVGEGYKAGYVTRDDYTSTLRTYQHSCDEIKSEGRMKATKFSDKMSF